MYVFDAVSMQKPHKQSIVKCQARAVSWTFHGRSNIINQKSTLNLCYFPQYKKSQSSSNILLFGMNIQN